MNSVRNVHSAEIIFQVKEAGDVLEKVNKVSPPHPIVESYQVKLPHLVRAQIHQD